MKAETPFQYEPVPPKKPGGRNWTVLAWPIVFMLASVLLTVAFYPPQAKTVHEGVTLEAFQSLENGMDYGEVVKVLGTPGEEVPDPVGETYSWMNPDMSHVILTFRSGRLVHKYQSGL